MTNNEEQINEELNELVAARLKTLPADREIFIGSDGSYTPQQLIHHIEKGDEIGKMMVEIERNYLTALKDGTLYE